MDRNRLSNHFTPQTSIIQCWLILLAGWLSGCHSGANSQAGLDPGFARMLDAVVRIDVRSVSLEEGTQRSRRGVGSGVIVTREGHILTNAHVVSPKAEEVMVTLASLERVPAKLVGWDHWTDLALLQMDRETLSRRNLTFAVASLADVETLRPGQEVYAVGTPNGLSRSVTRGIISNTDRYFSANDQIDGYETGYFHTWLQTDAAINPGNSGGPLALPNGRVVGINTRSYLGANNLGFAVPARVAEAVTQKLLRQGRVTRSYIGIRPAPLQDLESFFQLAANQGVLVDSVDPGSPAQKAGLLPGDILLALDQRPLDGRFPEQLPAILQAIASKPVGTEIHLLVKTTGGEKAVVVTTEELESRMGEQMAFERWGMTVQKVSKAFARERLREDDQGVIVIGTQPAFPASISGLQPGDMIIRANRQTLDHLSQLRSVYEEFAQVPAPVLLEVERNRQISYLVLQPR